MCIFVRKLNFKATECMFYEYLFSRNMLCMLSHWGWFKSLLWLWLTWVMLPLMISQIRSNPVHTILCGKLDWLTVVTYWIVTAWQLYPPTSHLILYICQESYSNKLKIISINKDFWILTHPWIWVLLNDSCVKLGVSDPSKNVIN